MLSLHLSGVFMSFLVLWLSAIAIVLWVLPQMLEILSIAAVRQSCGQVSEFQFIAKGMDVKTFFFFSRTCLLKLKQKERYLNSENPGATEVKFGFLGLQICNTSQGHERAKINSTWGLSLKGKPNTKILLFTLLIFVFFWNYEISCLREAFEIMFH